MGARAGWGVLTLFACGLVGFAAGPQVRAAEPKEEAVEAELLRDLDLLRETNMAQQGEFFRHMKFLERLRFLESLKFLEGSPPTEPATEEGK